MSPTGLSCEHGNFKFHHMVFSFFRLASVDNVNMTSPTVSRQPSTPSEWQLYVVLQRANLLSYYETFISQGQENHWISIRAANSLCFTGGDDVQQLIDADDTEFLEIMALMGMASKPLHVRRLQKALQVGAFSSLNFDLGRILPSSRLTLNFVGIRCQSYQLPFSQLG